jgi:hypothetical protein
MMTKTHSRRFARLTLLGAAALSGVALSAGAAMGPDDDPKAAKDNPEVLAAQKDLAAADDAAKAAVLTRLEDQYAKLARLTLVGTKEGCASCHANVHANGVVDDLHVALLADAANDAGTGAALAPVDDGLRAQLNLGEGRGLIVKSLAPEGPAAQAGLAANDILLYLADRPLAKPDDLEASLKDAGEKPVELKLLRNGKPTTLKVRPRYRVLLAAAEDKEKAPDYYIGVQSVPIEESLRAHLDIPAGQGLIVNEVMGKDTPAAKAGLKKNDILLELGGKPLTDVETLVAQIQATAGKPTALKILRGGKPTTIEVTPEKRPAQPEANAAAVTVEGTLRNWVTQPHREFYVQPYYRHFAPQQGWGVYQPMPHGYDYPPMQPPPAVAPPAAPAAPGAATGRLEKRLDELSGQIDGLRKSVDDLRRAINSSRDR